MIEIRDFIAEMRKEKIEYNYLKIYISEKNDLGLLKKKSFHILKDFYINHIITSEYGDDWKEAAWDKRNILQSKLQNFENVENDILFKKYNIHEIIEKYGKEYPEVKFDSNPLSNKSLSNTRIHRRIEFSMDDENLFRCSKILFNNINESILLNLNTIVKYENLTRFPLNLNFLKFLYNNNLYSLYIEESGLTYLKFVIDDKHSKEVIVKKFLTDWNRISYKEFQTILDEFVITASEFWYIFLHFDQIYSKNKIKPAYKNPDIIKSRESFEVSTDFNLKNQYEEEFDLILKDEYATSKIIKKIEFNGNILESHFTDFQAFHICKGLKNQRPLYNKYVNKNYNSDDIFRAHELANTLLKNHGKKMIDFLLSLPTLPFKSQNFKILFSTLDKIKEKGINKNPIIRLKVKNENNDFDEVEFSFYSIDRTDYINQIAIKNITKKNSVCMISRDGRILPSENTSETGKNKNITPILKLFYQITKDKETLDNEIVSFGLETGKCSICGRKLEDENSIIKGIGPICESYLY